MIGPDDWSSNANRALVRELLGLPAESATAASTAAAPSDARDSVTLNATARPAR
jgi:hypothetical protein